MNIKINGKAATVDKSKTIAQLIADKRFVPDNVMVEHNLRIVPKEEWDKIALNDADTVEIISFVGGG